MFTEGEWGQLVWKLYRATRQDSIKWELEGTWPSKSYIYFGESGLGYRVSSVDSDGQFPFRFEVIQEADRDSPIDAFITTPFHPADEGASQAVDELHAMIVRQVSGASDTFRKLLADLEGVMGDEQPF